VTSLIKDNPFTQVGVGGINTGKVGMTVSVGRMGGSEGVTAMVFEAIGDGLVSAPHADNRRHEQTPIQARADIKEKDTEPAFSLLSVSIENLLPNS
jgi:hypothetical protein